MGDALDERSDIGSIVSETQDRRVCGFIDEALAQAVMEVKEKLFHCSVCNSITSVDPCRYCSDPQRDRAGIRPLRV